MVVSADRTASEIGVNIMRRGGNAVDAAVAVGFALAVTFPEAGNIGGGGFMLIRKNDGSSVSVDFREKAPSASTETMYLDSAGNVTDKSFDGHLAAGVPGTVAGLITALQKYGTMRLADVIQPAIDAAELGVIVDYRLAATFEDYRDVLLRYPSTVAAFTRNGELFREGDTLRQPALAATLRRIQKKGMDGFYSGETADDIVDEMRKGGGIITLKDLANYRAVVREPLVQRYRGYDIIAMAPPSSGGLCLFELLRAVERYDLASLGYHSSRSVHIMAEAMKRVYADRAEYMGDADFVKMPTKELVSDVYAARRYRDLDTMRATPADSIGAGNPSSGEGANTTHYSVIDSLGNSVATTYTLNDLFGCKVVAGKAGFFLNDEMDDFSSKPGVPNAYGLIGSHANAIAPGKRMLSSMAPTIVVKNGKPVFILGARGGSRIITTVFEAIINVADYGMNGQEAVDAPRFHHQWKPDSLLYEKFCFPDDVVRRLTELGQHPVEKRYASGELEAIYIDPESGILYGAPDPREGGVAAGF
jgi:gamma-glutamyltranspeptidase/glutathione hydrolase